MIAEADIVSDPRRRAAVARELKRALDRPLSLAPYERRTGVYVPSDKAELIERARLFRAPTYDEQASGMDASGLRLLKRRSGKA